MEIYNKYAGDNYREVHSGREKPDALIQNTKTHSLVGVELTSVYLNDRSVVERHQKKGLLHVPYDVEILEKLDERIIELLKRKIHLAENYEKFPELALSIYFNEYEAIYYDDRRIKSLTDRGKCLFDRGNPFSCICLWLDINSYWVLGS